MIVKSKVYKHGGAIVNMSAVTESSLDAMKMAHIGAEIVVIGGVVFWVNRRTTDLQDQITSLSEQVNKCEDLIKRQSELLTRHENVIRQVFGQQGPSVAPRPPPAPPAPPVPTRTHDGSAARANVATTVSSAEEDVDKLIAEELAELDSPPPLEEYNVDDERDIKPKKK